MSARGWRSFAALALLSAIAATYWRAGHRRASSKPRDDSKRIALVFDVGGRGDKSFNDAAYAGLERAKAELGVRTAYIEPSSGEERESALRMFAAAGYDLVIAVGFVFSSDVDRVSADMPRARFACVDYSPGPHGVPPNVAALSFREEEGSFLVGALAGRRSKTGKLGFVGGMRGPLIRRFELGYTYGVKSACPHCDVDIAYAGASPEAYRDPAKGKTLAEGQISRGVDIIFHASGATGHGVFEAAREAHASAIGVDVDQYDEAPGVVITSMLKRADVAVYNVIRELQQGVFKPGLQVAGAREGAIDYVHEGPHAASLSPELIEQVEGFRQKLLRGEIVVPRE